VESLGCDNRIVSRKMLELKGSFFLLVVDDAFE
jgi:hypothetical protein